MMITSDEELKNLLLEKQRALRTKVTNLSTIAHDGVGYTNHQADDGTEAFDQASNLAILKRSQNTLRLIDDALAKFENGTYRTCERCGKTIDIARLEAIPWTPLCMSCAESRDYHGA